MPAMLTLAPDVAVPQPDDGTAIRYSETAVQDVMDFFSLLCFGQNEWAGEPFVLAEWETDAIRKFYGVQAQDEDGSWTRYRRFLYDELPKKTGNRSLRRAWGSITCWWMGKNAPRLASLPQT